MYDDISIFVRERGGKIVRGLEMYDIISHLPEDGNSRFAHARMMKLQSALLNLVHDDLAMLVSCWLVYYGFQKYLDPQPPTETRFFA